MYKRMHVLVEGPNDKDFFNAVIRPICEERYDYVQIWEYAGETIERRIKYIRSILAMNADYLFVADINASPCITEKKSRLVDSHKRMIEASRMVVVVKEIESWYMAGIGDESCEELELASLPHTDNIMKEQFEKLIPQRFVSVVDFMSEILKRFSLDTAKKKNKSFSYFMSKIKRDQIDGRY